MIDLTKGISGSVVVIYEQGGKEAARLIYSRKNEIKCALNDTAPAWLETENEITIVDLK